MANGKVQWSWNSSPDPFTTGDAAQWTPYSEEDNQLIEEKFQSQQPKVELKSYVIHFDINTQIHKSDFNRQRQIKREVIEEKD